MSKTDLQEWLINNSGFKCRYTNLVLDSVANQFKNLIKSENTNKGSHDCKYLLMCASLLSQSEKEDHQKHALRIAQFCLEYSDSSEIEKHGAAIILDSLSNHQAILLAEKRNLIEKDYFERLPFTLFQDWTKRSLENSIVMLQTEMDKSLKVVNLLWISMKGICYEEGTQTV